MRYLFRSMLWLLALCACVPAVCAQQQQERAQREGHSRAVVAMAFAPDGTKIVSGSQDETLKLWDAQTGTLLRTIHVYPKKTARGGLLGSVVFSPDSRTIAAGSRYTPIQQWEVATGRTLRSFPAPARSAATPQSVGTQRQQQLRRSKAPARAGRTVTHDGTARDMRRSERR